MRKSHKSKINVEKEESWKAAVKKSDIQTERDPTITYEKSTPVWVDKDVSKRDNNQCDHPMKWNAEEDDKNKRIIYKVVCKNSENVKENWTSDESFPYKTQTNVSAADDWVEVCKSSNHSCKNMESKPAIKDDWKRDKPEEQSYCKNMESRPPTGSEKWKSEPFSININWKDENPEEKTYPFVKSVPIAKDVSGCKNLERGPSAALPWKAEEESSANNKIAPAYEYTNEPGNWKSAAIRRRENKLENHRLDDNWTSEQPCNHKISSGVWKENSNNENTKCDIDCPNRKPDKCERKLDAPGHDFVMTESECLPAGTPKVNGYDWNCGINYSNILDSYLNSGFQATNFGKGVLEINKMIESRKIPLCQETSDIYEDDIFIKRKYNCTIFLGYTSNIVSSGLRETIRFLVQNKMVDCIVTTGGGVEEDLIKCMSPSYIGAFDLDGKILREKGLNRIGNVLVPNDNYCKFEKWVTPLLDEMLNEQNSNNVLWTPSKVIQRLGERINCESSICYWAAKNHIPIFCPAITDGSLGDMMYFHSFRNPGLVLDIVSDLRRINTIAVKATQSGMIIVGGGVIKHHICNANLMRNGADYSVFLNTGTEYDGSDSGAAPNEAVSWGKIRTNATPVKIFAEASLVLPLLVGQTFAKDFYENKNQCCNKK